MPSNIIIFMKQAVPSGHISIIIFMKQAVPSGHISIIIMAATCSYLVFDSFLLFFMINTAVSINVTCPSSPVRKYNTTILAHSG